MFDFALHLIVFVMHQHIVFGFNCKFAFDWNFVMKFENLTLR